jgi:hypothetical protein
MVHPSVAGRQARGTSSPHVHRRWQEGYGECRMLKSVTTDAYLTIVSALS